MGAQETFEADRVMNHVAPKGVTFPASEDVQSAIKSTPMVKRMSRQ